MANSERAEGSPTDKSTSNFKLITTTSGVRVSQACDRCRIKKIKCDGQYPCHNCSKIGFECKTSDKLTRRAFPKGYTENLEKKLKEMEEENRLLKIKYEGMDSMDVTPGNGGVGASGTSSFNPNAQQTKEKVLLNQNIQINNPIDQIFNLDAKGIIIGNDNLNFESQFNHLLINLNLPFLKITNSHNYLLNDPNSYLYHPSFSNYNKFHNRDLDVIYNPLTGSSYNKSKGSLGANFDEFDSTDNELPFDVYDLFIKLINNFKKIFDTKRDMDNQIIQYFLNYNIFIPIFDYKQFMESYDAFHTMYPFVFTYDDSTINGFNLSNNNDYHIVNEYLMIIIQIYAIIMINDPTINLNLLLNHSDPSFSHNKKVKDSGESPIPAGNSLITSLYDFLPYFNAFHVSISHLRTYQLFLYYSLLTNNKEKSLILSSLINSFIGILGINLNSKNLFFNDLSLNLQQKRDRVKIFWVFKVLLKCFNLKFGFKPSINTTVINPVTIDRYFQLTPEKLSELLGAKGGMNDDLFDNLLKPSIEFLNLMNIIIPSSFAPNYYEYLKQGKKKGSKEHHKDNQPKHLDWILNEDDGEGNDGNLNYNFNQFLTIDKNLSNWRKSLKQKTINLVPFHLKMGLPNLLNITSNDLYHDLKFENSTISSGISQEGLLNYYSTGLPDIHTASQMIKIQLNFHYIIIRSMNYLNFIVDKELNFPHYVEISKISREVLHYFLLIFNHLNHAKETMIKSKNPARSANNIVMESLGLDVDEDGFVINDFSVKRRRTSHATHPSHSRIKRMTREIPKSPFNFMLNGLSMTIINLKKSIILQMVYLLICQLKFFKREEYDLIGDISQTLDRSIDLFIKIFINYKTNVVKPDSREKREDVIFKKLINDQLKDEILKDQEDSDDDDDETRNSNSGGYRSIDWDDEEMDEDLKFLKILKFIKYKSNYISERISLKKEKEQIIPAPKHVTHHTHIHHMEDPASTASSTSHGSNIENSVTSGKNNNSSINYGSSAATSTFESSGHTGNPLEVSNSTSLPRPNYFAQGGLSSVGSPTNFGMNKFPSLSKLDYFMGDYNSTTPNSNTRESNPGSGYLHDDELMKKEKLVINDLMSLRHGSQGSIAKFANSSSISNTNAVASPDLPSGSSNGNNASHNGSY